MGRGTWEENKQGEPLQASPVISFSQRLEDAIEYDGEEGYCDECEEESLEYLFGLFLFLGFACFEFCLVRLMHSERVLLGWLIKMLCFFARWFQAREIQGWKIHCPLPSRSGRTAGAYCCSCSENSMR